MSAAGGHTCLAPGLGGESPVQRHQAARPPQNHGDPGGVMGVSSRGAGVGPGSRVPAPKSAGVSREGRGPGHWIASSPACFSCFSVANTAPCQLLPPMGCACPGLSDPDTGTVPPKACQDVRAGCERMLFPSESPGAGPGSWPLHPDLREDDSTGSQGLGWNSSAPPPGLIPHCPGPQFPYLCVGPW